MKFNLTFSKIITFLNEVIIFGNFIILLKIKLYDSPFLNSPYIYL